MSIFRHGSLKLLALVVAALLWFHVATNQDYDVEIPYRINYVNIPANLVLAEPPAASADILMRGSGKALLRLMWGERHWAVDLSEARVGRQRLVIPIEAIPMYGIQGLTILGIAGGDSLTVVLDSMESRIVPIRGM